MRSNFRVDNWGTVYIPGERLEVIMEWEELDLLSEGAYLWLSELRWRQRRFNNGVMRLRGSHSRLGGGRIEAVTEFVIFDDDVTGISWMKNIAHAWQARVQVMHSDKHVDRFYTNAMEDRKGYKRTKSRIPRYHWCYTGVNHGRAQTQYELVIDMSYFVLPVFKARLAGFRKHTRKLHRKYGVTVI